MIVINDNFDLINHKYDVVYEYNAPPLYSFFTTKQMKSFKITKCDIKAVIDDALRAYNQTLIILKFFLSILTNSVQFYTIK